MSKALNAHAAARSFVSYAAASAFFIIILAASFPQCVQAKTLYRYVDKDGTVILTDQEPPQGTSAQRRESIPEPTEDQKSDAPDDTAATIQKEGTEQKEKADAKNAEKQEKIKTLINEIEAAKSDIKRYEVQRNIAVSNVRKNYVKSQIEQKLKEIAEKEEELQVLQEEP
ncbi:MAG: DUF4124 domain-containing protein [Deltaproteobacteria bacterium]|nr:DUF4124 domain-containing protein [Deltaproteobacteria bacterium]